MAWFLHTHATNHPPAIQPTHIGYRDVGLSPALYALVFCTVSGLSLPLGAWLGTVFAPVSDKITSMMLAFGAGALLFAVTVELYGHALTEVAAGRTGLVEMSTTIFAALTGCAFYLVINQALDSHVQDTTSDDEGSQESDPLMQHLRLTNPEKADSDQPFQAAKTFDTAEMSHSKSKEKAFGAAKTFQAAETSHFKSHVAASILAKKGVIRGREMSIKTLALSEEAKHARSVAFALFAGLLIDGVPEGILMGFLAAENHLTPVLIVSLFIANFPEAFSSSSLLIQAQMGRGKIVAMWTGLCLLVGCLGGLSCWLLLLCWPEFGAAGFHSNSLPFAVLLGIAATEGVTGGAMLACISGVMLPEAFQRGKESGANSDFYSHSGFLCVAGFLLSL